MRIVLGLGNPGERYRRTRHNLGFRVADLVASRAGVAFARQPGLTSLAWTAEIEIGGERVVLAKPRTLMNRSGRAAAALCARLSIEPSDLLVVHDDADLDLGRVRIRLGGSAGGHNGIRSLIDTMLCDGFSRIKLGVRGLRRGDAELADYVLDAFEPDEDGVAEGLVAAGADAVQAVLDRGLAAAMNEFNRLRVDPD